LPIPQLKNASSLFVSKTSGKLCLCFLSKIKMCLSSVSRESAGENGVGKMKEGEALNFQQKGSARWVSYFK
jgi:hypothetical protein